MMFLLGLLTVATAFAAELVVAVNYFDAHSIRPDLEPLGRGASDMLVTDLGSAPGLRMVERARLSEVLAELDLARSGFVDPATAQRLGKGVGANVIVVGSITVAIEGMRLDARAIDVATGEVRASAQATGKDEEFFKLEHEVAEKLLAGLGVKTDVAERPLALGQILDGAKAIDAADTATLARLGGLHDYKAKRLVRVPYEFSITTGSNGSVSTIAGSTWVVRDGGGTTFDVPDFAERVKDTGMSERLARQKQTARIVGSSMLVGGAALCVAAIVPALQMEEVDYESRRWLAASERNSTRLYTSLGLLGGGIVVGYMGVWVPGRQRAKTKWFENYYTAEEADRLLRAENAALAAELNLSSGDVLQLELRE